MKRKFSSMWRVVIAVVMVVSLGLVIAVPVMAQDGSGTCAVSPTEVTAGSTGNTLTFTFIAAETMDGGAISITVPPDGVTGWSVPQDDNSAAVGYTTCSSTGITAKVLDTLDDDPIAWEKTDADVTLSAEPTEKKEGANSLKSAVAGTAIGGEKWWKVAFTAEDWSSYTSVGFWIRSSVAASAGELLFEIDNNDALASPVESIAIPALSANTWEHVTLTFAELPATRVAIVTYGIEYAVDYAVANPVDVYVDEILIGPDDAEAISFAAQVATVRILALANGETITVVYGAGPAGATAQQAAGTATFTTKSAVTADLNLVNISTHPQVTVNPDSIHHFALVTEHAGTEVAGTAFSITVTAQDLYDNTATSYIGAAVSITFTSTATAAPDDTPPTIPSPQDLDFNSNPGIATATGFILVNADETPTITATDGTYTGTSASITINPASHAAYTVVPAALTQRTGIAFTVTITAVDEFENTVTTIDGTLNGYTFTFSGPSNAPDGTAPTYVAPSFTGGISSPSVTLVCTETVALTVTDSQSPAMTGTSASITVNPAPHAPHVVPAAYVETNLFGIEADFRISDESEILETIEATSEDGMLTITVPEGTIALDKEGDPLSTLEAGIDESPPPPPEDAYIIGLAYDLGPAGATFDPPITLEYTYDPDALPEGIAEEDLVLAYYDEEAGKWVELDCVVDTENNTITADVDHFTTFAVIGAVTPPPPPPAPAAFTSSSLSISPLEVDIGETVSISILVANTGEEEGSYTITLKINGVVEETEEVTLAGGASETVTFTTAKDEAGTYSVGVDGLTGSFTVKEAAPPPPAPPGVNWAIWGPIIAVGVFLAIFLPIRRRRRA